MRSLKYCQQEKNLKVSAWCMMTSHIHMAIGTNGEYTLKDIIRELKSHTSWYIRKYMGNNPQESRGE